MPSDEQRAIWRDRKRRYRAESKEKARTHRVLDAMRRSEYRIRSRINPSAIVPWANRAIMEGIYRRCFELNQAAGHTAFEVDHIIPLAHDEVCGLHCEQNLRIVEWMENKRKGNFTFERDHNIDMMLTPTGKEF